MLAPLVPSNIVGTRDIVAHAALCLLGLRPNLDSKLFMARPQVSVKCALVKVWLLAERTAKVLLVLAFVSLEISCLGEGLKTAGIRAEVKFGSWRSRVWCGVGCPEG